MHIGELETSILLHVNSELARDGYQSADWTADDRRHLLATGMRHYTASRDDRSAIAGLAR